VCVCVCVGGDGGLTQYKAGGLEVLSGSRGAVEGHVIALGLLPLLVRHSVFNAADTRCDISGTPGGNFITSGKNFPPPPALDSSVN